MNLILKRLFLFLLLSGLLACAAAAQSTIFLVRHAEKVDESLDPNLSAAGHGRAQRLATVLRDARISAIFVTEFKRTRQTANPLAQMINVIPQSIPKNNSTLLITRLRGSTGNVLVVGHSDTIPEVIRGLNILTPIQIGGAAYDNMFVLWRGPTNRLVRLHYR